MVTDMNQASHNGESPIRMNQQRRAILAELSVPNRHLTADMVYERVRERVPNISLGTVYRNLDLLSRHGLVRKLCLGDAQSWYDGGLHRHYHVRCMSCGAVADVAAGEFGELLEAANRVSDYEIVDCELSFRGYCPGCSGEAVDEPKATDPDEFGQDV